MATFVIHSFKQRATYTIEANATGITRIQVAKVGEPAYDIKPGKSVDIEGTKFTVGDSWRNLSAECANIRTPLEQLHSEFPVTRYPHLAL